MRVRSLLLVTAVWIGLHAAAVQAQPHLVVKAFTIANGVQSPTITVASGQYVTAPASSVASYVYYSFQNTGNQTLTQSETYAGATIVNAGTLTLNGAGRIAATSVGSR